MYKKENFIFGIILNFVIIFLYFKTRDLQSLVELKNIIIYVILIYITGLIILISNLEDKTTVKELKKNEVLFSIFYVSSFSFIIFTPILMFIFTLLIVYIKRFIDTKINEEKIKDIN